LGSRRAEPGSARRGAPRLERGDNEILRECFMRARELRELSDDELDRRMAETRQELFNLRFQTATGVLENSARLRLAKREIARILTVKSERDEGTS
jgi:large subunit ribosomal protein L29